MIRKALVDTGAVFILIYGITLALSDAPALQIADYGLMLRKVGAPRCLFRLVQPDQAERAAGVRRAHGFLLAPDGSKAAVFVTLNRQRYLLPIRILKAGPLAYGQAVAVPKATKATFSPRSDALLLTCTNDPYRPSESTNRLNCGAMVVRLTQFAWYSSFESALHEPGQGPWYGCPEDRFVPAGDFEILSQTWRNGGCFLKIRGGKGGTRTFTIR